MKARNLFLLFIIMIIYSSCEKVEIPDVPNFDQTLIISLDAYDKHKKRIIIGEPRIDSDNGLIEAIVEKNTDLSNIFIIGGFSTGATICPIMGRYEDWSSMEKQYIVSSSSGKRQQKWTVKFLLEK